ncbi:CxxxxCH/CxxCH domain-containing protein, partial [Acidobacteriota bacterium]
MLSKVSLPAILMFLLGIMLFVGCSERSTPTSDLPDPQPGGSDQPGGTPVVLTETNHSQGWNRTACLACHQPGLISYHHELSRGECMGCHGDNGTQPGYRLCLDCHGNPPGAGAHTLHINLSNVNTGCDTCHLDAGIYRADRHRDGVVQVNLNQPFGGTFRDGTCSKVSCHGIGKPDWRQDKNLECLDCHDPDNSADNGPFSGKHVLHHSAGFDCGICHVRPPSTHHNASLEPATLGEAAGIENHLQAPVDMSVRVVVMTDPAIVVQVIDPGVADVAARSRRIGVERLV